MAGDGHGAIGANRDEYQRVVNPAVWHRVGAVLRLVCGESRPRKTDRKDQAHGRDRAEECAPAYIDQFEVALRGAHHAPPSDATCLIAARMRVYVPQRQMLPLIAASISSSVGRRFCLRSAVAAIICPDWQ